MARFARDYRVLYWEEPIFEAAAVDRNSNERDAIDAASGVVVVVPKLPEGWTTQPTERL